MSAQPPKPKSPFQVAFEALLAQHRMKFVRISFRSPYSERGCYQLGTPEDLEEMFPKDQYNHDDVDGAPPFAYVTAEDGARCRQQRLEQEAFKAKYAHLLTPPPAAEGK